MRSSGGCARAGWPARLSRRAAPLRRPGAGAPGVVVRGGRGAGPGVGGVPAVRTGSGATSVPEPPGRGAAGPHARRRYGRGTPCAPASRAGRARGPPGQRVAVRHPRRSGTPGGGAVPARGNAAGPAARWGACGPGSAPAVRRVATTVSRARAVDAPRLAGAVRVLERAGAALPAWARDPAAVHQPGRPCRVAHGDWHFGQLVRPVAGASMRGPVGERGAVGGGLAPHRRRRSRRG